MTPKDAAELKRVFIEIAGHFKVAGLPLEDPTLGQMTEALRAIGLPVDEGGVAEVERRWREIQPMLLQAAVDPEVEAYLHADVVFQRVVDEIGNRTVIEALSTLSPGVGAIVATRFVEATVGNGGWVAIFVEPGQAELLPSAMHGYRTLGLMDHATLAQEAIQRFAAKPDDLRDETWDDLDSRWLDLPDAELGRAAYIEANPAEFARYRDATVG